jgi:GAF domain-containing protein
MEAPTDAGPTSPGGDHQFALVLDLMRQIDDGASLERVFGLVAGTLRQIFAIDRFAVVLMHEDGSLRITDSRGLSDSYLQLVQQRITEGAGARALSQRKPMWIADAAHSPDYWPLQEAARAEGFHTVLILPLFAGADPLGYIIMYHDEVRTYTLAEVALAQALAQQAAFAVRSARLLAATEARRAELERC